MHSGCNGISHILQTYTVLKGHWWHRKFGLFPLAVQCWAPLKRTACVAGPLGCILGPGFFLDSPCFFMVICFTHNLFKSIPSHRFRNQGVHAIIGCLPAYSPVWNFVISRDKMAKNTSKLSAAMQSAGRDLRTTYILLWRQKFSIRWSVQNFD